MHLLFRRFLETALTTERKKGGSFLLYTPNTRTTDETFQQSGKKDPFRHIEKIS